MSGGKLCQFLVPFGVHAVACGASGEPAVAVLRWPDNSPFDETACCFKHAHESACIAPGAHWEWLTTTTVRTSWRTRPIQGKLATGECPWPTN